MPWYPKRKQYFAPFAEGDEIEQGDIFWGVPTLVARHPALSDNFRQPLTQAPTAEILDPPPLSDVIAGVGVFDDPIIILPHTCDFYGPEKGRRNRARLVARIERLTNSGIADADRRLVRSGDGFNHTFFLPSWEDSLRDLDDMFVNFRYMTSIDAAYVSRRRRVARLSNAAVIALRRRVAHFFTDYAPAPAELALADTSGGLVRNDRDLSRLGLASESGPHGQEALIPTGSENVAKAMPWAEWLALLNDMGFSAREPWTIDDLKAGIEAQPNLEIARIIEPSEDAAMDVTIEIVHVPTRSLCTITLTPGSDGEYRVRGLIMGAAFGE